MGAVLIVFSESLIAGSMFFNYKLSKAIFWTLFTLKVIGMILIFNADLH